MQNNSTNKEQGPGWQLKELLQPFMTAEVSATLGATRVTGLSLNSQALAEGNLFVALQGLRANGAQFVKAARQAGASAVLIDPNNDLYGQLDSGLPVIAIDGLADQLGNLAARFYRMPSAQLTCIGITGTNGKTSSCFYLAQLLHYTKAGARQPVALLGTLGAGLYSPETQHWQATGLTTPDAIRLQACVADFVAKGCGYLCMEVSSHALEQGRVTGMQFDTAVFTNLSRDHLDYHGDMQAYGQAKQKLFAMPELNCAVINLDDGFGRQIAAQLAPSVRCMSFAIDNPKADLQLRILAQQAQGFRVALSYGEQAIQVDVPLLGRFNLYNLAAALAVLLAEQSLPEPTLEALAPIISKLQPVEGRMQGFRQAGAPLVVVDYAHTPDALEQALTALREHCTGALHVVVGCGGDRDVGKRPQMAQVAVTTASAVWLTNDNPRSEEPKNIIKDMLAGISEFTGEALSPESMIEIVYDVPADKPASPPVNKITELNGTAVHIELDRRRAIHQAIDSAAAQDIVLIAGKGHEDYQEICGVRQPFKDAEQVILALQQRVGTASSSAEANP